VPDRHLTLVCEDVAAGATFFRDVLSLPVQQHDRHRADVDLGTRTATLTSGPSTGSGPAPIVTGRCPSPC
jgi:catechol 2,3-dioxygenase-like lactoylglutathione lyase family enzyme